MNAIIHIRCLLALVVTMLISVCTYGQITGSVMDNQGDPMIGATVAIPGTTTGTIVDNDGTFALDIDGNGAVIQVSMVGYKTQTFEVTDGQSLNIVLMEDILGLDEVVITGTANPKSKLESSVAITSLSSKSIQQLAPKSTADLLQSIPGFLVETSGGESGNNLFARGIPSAGAYEYVQFQEDGLPVFEDGALQFANIDNFQRVDATVSRVEAVKGGSASIYATGAPGGIINFISKTGTNDFGGHTKLTVGDYGLLRTDMNLSGPLVKDKLFYNVGGFYRVDQGIRSPGFDANKGGQIKANLSYQFDRGQAKVYYKHLNDRTIFYQSTPFKKNGDDIEGIDGFDPNYGTFTSRNYSKLKVPQAGGSYFEADLEDGIHPISNAVGTYLSYQISDNVTVKNALKATDIDLDYNAIFAAQWMGDVSSQDAIASNYGIADGNAVFTYNATGEALNASDLLKRADYWNIKKRMQNLANNLSFQFDLGQVNLTAGYYYSNWKSDQNWNWSSFLVTATDDPQLVNLEDADPEVTESITNNGVTAGTWLQRESQIKGRLNAVYTDAELTVNDKVTVNVGLRYDSDKYAGVGDHGTWGNDIGILPNSQADNGVNILTGNYVYWDYDVNELSYTGALNYKLNNNMAAYLRHSHGFRAPIEESFYGPAVEAGAGSKGLEDLKVTTVDQTELGYKYSDSGFAIFANAFLMNLGNIAYQDIGAGGTSEKKFASVRNLGLELEVIKSFGPLNLRLMGTAQNPEYVGYEGSEEALNGNIARRISKFYFTVRPEYVTKDGFGAYLNYAYFGKKYQDIGNTFELPGFGNLGMGLSYQYNNVRFALDGTNLMNTIGLTEADGLQSGAVPTDGQIFMGRSILGRAFRFSVGVDF